MKKLLLTIMLCLWGYIIGKEVGIYEGKSTAYKNIAKIYSNMKPESRYVHVDIKNNKN